MLVRLPYIFFSFVLFTVILAGASIIAPTAYAQVALADFRIIDVTQHDNHLVVEVEHFKSNGDFDYFENYLWEGREGTKFPRAVNPDGLALLKSGSIAPGRMISGTMQMVQYLPPNEEWQLEATPFLDQKAILSVIQDTHNKRKYWTENDWPENVKRGQSRLLEPELSFNAQDSVGINVLVSTHSALKDSAYKTQINGNLSRHTGILPPVHLGEGRIEYGTVSTFYPSLDGRLGTNVVGAGAVWSTLYNGAGTSADHTASTFFLNTNSTSTTNQFGSNFRDAVLFDTSALGSGATITDATLEVVVTSIVATLFADTVGVGTSDPASTSALVSSDYANSHWTSTRQATDIAVSSLTADSSTYNVFTLNATGKGNINKTGITKFGLRYGSDLDGTGPTWTNNNLNAVTFASAEETLPGDKRPRLVVTHVTPVAAITGTIGDGATEQEVREGGTILVTLTDDTFVAAGGTFDAQRQAIIDGLDAASSPTTGWNNEVRDSIGVASVVRTSDTLATITLSTSEVAGYAITSGETITVTVPAAALTGGVAITATPTIAITAVTESAAITGTIGDGATEQEVRDGGGTILITLTNTTWAAAAGSLFDNQRQNIIDGLVAADSQTYGWNNEVKDKLGVTAVVRTSDTLVTITIPAGDVEDYRIVTNEVITTTVPATAIGGAALVATPTTTITGSVESAAVSGTLGGSGGTASEIEAGGETVIITLTNTTWVTAGATFNAQRQNILDGLVADDSDVNGWNAMAFAVGDVVRTSGTIVTITLSAESGYAIPSAETVTTTVPATAIVYGASLVAPETFTISPAAFATSGTRVSTAINLASITNLAYCAIGWEATLPTNTSVAIATSVDGGSNYSTAINGNCPTGLTIGESLESITDFRVQATLTTTNTAVTPLITALGLILEDAGGSELCYQLLTTPSASLSDNCGTYTGTMSYPIGPSTITSSTASITSTAELLPDARALAGQDVAQAVTGSATSAKLFPDADQGGGFTGLPLNDLVNEMSTVGDGLPVRFVWFIFLGIATIGAGMMAVHLTSNLFIAAGAMAAVMGFQMAIGTTGLLPGWILFAFIPLAAAYLLFRRGFPA
jgi:hypothetical protein